MLPVPRAQRKGRIFPRAQEAAVVDHASTFAILDTIQRSCGNRRKDQFEYRPATADSESKIRQSRGQDHIAPHSDRFQHDACELSATTKDSCEVLFHTKRDLPKRRAALSNWLPSLRCARLHLERSV